MQILSGGSGFPEPKTIHWYKIGKLVFIDAAIWGFKILNPTSDSLHLSLPFKCITARSYGIMGYNNSGINIIPGVTGGNTFFGFSLKNQNGSTSDIVGTQIPDSILQFVMLYETE